MQPQRKRECLGHPLRSGCTVRIRLQLWRKLQGISREASERLLSRNGRRCVYSGDNRPPRWLLPPTKAKIDSLSLYPRVDPDQLPVQHHSTDLSMPFRVWSSLWNGVPMSGTMSRYGAIRLQRGRFCVPPCRIVLEKFTICHIDSRCYTVLLYIQR